MAVEQTYVSVYCPHTSHICKVPVGMFNNIIHIQNYCDYSNGCAPCDECIQTIRGRITNDRNVVYKSHSEPLHLFSVGYKS